MRSIDGFVRKLLAANDRGVWGKGMELNDLRVHHSLLADLWPRITEKIPLKLRRELVRHRNKQKRFTDLI